MEDAFLIPRHPIVMVTVAVVACCAVYLLFSRLDYGLAVIVTTVVTLVLVGWKVALAALFSLIVIANSRPPETASATIETEFGPVVLRYKFVSGFDESSQTLTIKSSTRAQELTTDPVEVIKRHYWSGAKIYRTDDGRFLEIKLGERTPEEFYRYDIAQHALQRIKRDEMAVPAADQRSAHTRHVIRSGRKFLGRFCYGDVLPVELYGEPQFDDYECTTIAAIKMRRKVSSDNHAR